MSPRGREKRTEQQLFFLPFPFFGAISPRATPPTRSDPAAPPSRRARRVCAAKKTSGVVEMAEDREREKKIATTRTQARRLLSLVRR
jgi:hypothetical protein